RRHRPGPGDRETDCARSRWRSHRGKRAWPRDDDSLHSSGPRNTLSAMASVLIVDDEPNIRRMVGALLGAEGYDVRDAADGATGLGRVRESEPDVVLLDLMMPGELDGLATLAQLREAAPDVPVVMM